MRHSSKAVALIKHASVLGLLGLTLSSNAAHARPMRNPPGDVEAPTGGSPSTPTPVEVKGSSIKVRVELERVVSNDQQEITGPDELYTLSVFATPNHTSAKGSFYPVEMSKTPLAVALSTPVSIKQHESRALGAGEALFEGVVPGATWVVGGLGAFEEDTNKSWDKRGWWGIIVKKEVEEHINRIVALNLKDRPVHSTDGATMIEVAGKNWNETAKAYKGDWDWFDDDDHIANSETIIVPAEGPSVETRQWVAKNKECSYTIFYRITRSIATAPTPQPQTPTPTPQPPAPTPTPTPRPQPTPIPNFDLSTWVDEWETTYGVVKLQLQDGVLRGRLMQKTAEGLDREGSRLELRADGAREKLAGTADYTDFRTQIRLTLSADGNTFAGLNLPSGTTTPITWSGRRRRSTNTPPGTPTGPSNPRPTPTTPGIPTVPIGQQPGGTAGFLPLKYFEVCVDKVQPNMEGNKLEAYVTLRNRTHKMQFINGSVIQGVVTDEDGVGLLFMDFYSLEGAPTILGGNREIAPGGTFKVRLMVEIPQGAAPLKTLTLWEADSQPQTVDISRVRMPAEKPAANFGSLGLKGGTDEFKACGKVLDVRFDGIRKARDGSYEAAFIFRNTSESQLRTDVLDMHSSSVDIYLHDANGQRVLHDEILRPNGSVAKPMTTHIGIIPGGETKIRYRFRLEKGFTPVKLSVNDRPSSTTAEWALPTH